MHTVPDPFAGLRRQVRGDLLAPGDAGYDLARFGWNTRFDRRPAVIVRCRDAADVAIALAHARSAGMDVAVRGGGHDYAGNSTIEGGLLLDLSLMDAVHVDTDACVATVGAGATWAAVDRATAAHGLATPGATVSTVGVSGFTLGGGAGHLGRLHGLACDHLVAADLVTAGGEQVRVDAQSHPGLLWGLRGGGGNFGVVTSFDLRLHPQPATVLAGQLVHRFEDAAAVLRQYRDYMATAPDAVQCWAFLLKLPPLPAFPGELHGQVVLDLVAFHAGTPDDAAHDLAPLRAIGTPVLDGVAPLPYVDLQQAFDAGMPSGQRWYSRAHYLRGLPDAAIEMLLAHADQLPGEFTTVYLGGEGGALATDDGNSAFAHRDAAFSLHVFPGWTDARDDADIMRWTREVHRAMAPYATGGVYANMLADDEADRIGAAYGARYARLRELKRRWDPGNVFRSNHNIDPGR
ncbi:MAG TPA: FAD-binding oxidoreductase [Xanthomonadaceae bacterium]|nr:FAD-binding oxidoreductase [Xanthomonadaceae bacterium]